MQGGYSPADGHAPLAGPARTSGTATLSLVAGVLSFTCLFGLGGILAIVFGWLAHGEIERSEGRLTGKGLASTGIGLGIANLVASVVSIGVLIALAVRPEPPGASLPAPPPPVAVAPLPAPAAPGTAPAPAPSPDVAAEETLPTLPSHVGKIEIVEASGGALEPQLRAQLAESTKAGQHLLLWTVTPDCEPCAAVGRALPDARMQRALAGIRLVRADARNYASELHELGVPLDAFPGFTRLDARGRPLDFIHGGEWDDDIPANIAPILEKFVRGSPFARRHRWSRPLREGETPL